MSFGDIVGLSAMLVALIAMVQIIASVFKRRIAYAERRLELAASALPLTQTNAELEKRVRVLERIATQDGSAEAIAQEIEALRAETRLPLPEDPKPEATVQ